MEFKEILRGAISSDSKSNINFPLVKYEFILIHISIVMMLIIKRYISGDFSMKMWIIFWVVSVLQTMDLRQSYIRRYISRSILFFAIAFIPFLDANQRLVNIRDAFGWIKIVATYISPQDIIMIMFSFGAMLMSLRIYSLDVLWANQKLPGPARKIFLPAMVTYFVCRRFLGQALQEIFDAARFKAKILRGRGLWQRFQSYFGVLVKQTLLKFSEVVSITEVILNERDMIGYVRRNPISVHYTREDYIAGVGGLCVFIFTIKALFF